MYTDLPQCTRCCFCAPLRIGLLVWGYISMILSFVHSTFSIIGLVEASHRGIMISPALIILMLEGIVDVAFSILLVVAAHKKHEKLFRVYYIYSIVFFALLAIGCCVQLVALLASLLNLILFHPFVFNVIITSFVSVIALLLVQVYIILLVRSELFKLRDQPIQTDDAQVYSYVERL